MKGETLYSYVIGMLRDFLVKEAVFLQAIAGPVDDLRDKLTEMEELLEYADVRRDERTAEIIDLADHLIDYLEKYILRVVSKHFSFREHFLKRRPKVVLAVDNITTKINEFLKSQTGDRDLDASSGAARRAYKVQDLSRFRENEFVGREEDISKLVQYLVDEENEHFGVISIHGMGGLGKTTLARKLYKDKKVMSHFKSFAFVCVSEQCQTEEILKHILQQLFPHKEEEIKRMTDGDVIEWLQRVEREEKCLVVIDDIWSVRDWESLNIGLPKGGTGSKVLLTTRIKEVADKGFCYSLKCLSKDECWELLQKKIPFLSQDPQIARRMEELGRKMIAWCRGIPLAVLVLRGVLVTKGSLREWERFYESRNRGGELYDRFKGEVMEELLFSYVELPYPLKTCFLYLANFGEDEEIDVEELYMLWDAEGLILSKDKEAGETNIDVAKRYLEELVGRSMVEAKLADLHPNVERSFKSCRLHDLMRDLCLSIVKKENFLKVHEYGGLRDRVVVLNPSYLTNDTKVPPRQALYFAPRQEFEVHNEQKDNHHVRSLRLVGGSAKGLSKLKKLDLLRVLTLSETGSGKGEFINELIHLKCLKLLLPLGGMFPSSINLVYLQTLDLRDSADITMPNVFLRKLTRLRHLFLPMGFYGYKVTPEFSKLRMDGNTELETIVNFDSRQCEFKDVIQLTSLRRLECKIYISSEDDVKVWKDSMGKWNMDHSLLQVYSDMVRGQLAEYWKGHLGFLWIGSLRGKLLPEFSNHNRLTQLELVRFEVEEDPMPTLEKLPNLISLTLRLGELKGKEMGCSAMGFHKLRYMTLRSVKSWKKWRVEQGAMPSLFRLCIWECKELEKLPEGLKFITSLEVLQIRYMPQGFIRRLIGGEGGGDEGSDFHIIQHVPQVRIPKMKTRTFRQFSIKEIEAATNQFGKILGQGGEAKVYYAEIYIGSYKTPVAVKHLKENSKEFEREVQILSEIQHPNLVSLIGYCDESGHKILIYEYMAKGCLSDYLKKKSEVTLSWLQRLNICLDAARGLQHLHTETDEFPKGIIHRDIKPGNILVAENWVAKLSDFGMLKLSSAGQDKSLMTTNLKGTSGYYAPEYIKLGRITRKIDVYAFGVVLFEVLCRKRPWDREDESYYFDENEDLGIWAKQNVDSQIRGEASGKSLAVYTDIIGRSLQADPGRRPTMDDVVLDLQKALELLKLGLY